MAPQIAYALALVAGLLAPFAARAHHSYTEFDNTQTVEIEGTLRVVAWQNPHTHFEVRVVDSGRGEVVWDIETGPVNSLRRRGAPLDAFKVGDVIKIAGWPSKRTADRMYATNLLADGREFMFQTGTPRWPGSATYSEAFNGEASASAPPASKPTLFRVWSSDPTVDLETRNGFLNRAQISLTEAAKQAAAKFDPVNQSTTSGCTPKGMPILMGQPFPIEFLDRGDTILLHLEEYDAVRTIHMSSAAPPGGSSLLGYSVGRWEAGTLVVETDRLDSPYFNSQGVPLGKSANTLERFTVSGDGRRLSYELTVTDPDTFVVPARAARAWLARDGERVMPYDCKVPAR